MQNFFRFVPVVFALTSFLAGQERYEAKPDRPLPYRIEGDMSNPTVAARAQRPNSARPTILLVGYWPPSGEMLRPWSTNPKQNPKWIGSNWENRGYDVHAFFAEYTQTNFPWGQGDFEVDYQDTAIDWALVTQALKPRIIMTFSRGRRGDFWEYELNAINRATWSSDRRFPNTPTQTPPDPSLLANAYRRMTLPYREIAGDMGGARVPVTNLVDDYGNGGTYLSEYLSLLGLTYKGTHSDPSRPDWCAVAGHIHVGIQVPVAVGTQAVEVQLRRVIEHVERLVRGDCQVSLGGGGVGQSELTMCGSPLASGGRGDVFVRGIPANAASLLLLSATRQQQVLTGRIFHPAMGIAVPFVADAKGEWRIPGILGGGGPLSVFAQIAHADPRVLWRYSATNALQIRFLR